jgi:hypothetical protein
MKALIVTLCLLTATSAWAADSRDDHEADLAVKSAQVETLRARAAVTPTATTSTTLIEAENLLRQYRAAPAGKRNVLRSQLESALGRLELEIDAAGRGAR